MLTLVSTLLGLLTSGLPKLLDFFQNKSDQKHELALAAMQKERELALAAQGFAAQEKIEDIRTDQIAIQAEVDGIKSAHEHDKSLIEKSSKWVVNLNALVRPAVTFIFVLELVGINIFLAFYLWNDNTLITNFDSLMKYVDIIFSSEEMSMLGAIIGYWFGSRGWSKK